MGTEKNHTIEIQEFYRVFGRIGLLSFGGPAAQISVMHRELVEDRPWLDEPQFLRALSFCMLLPGPEAMQLATYAGWLKRGISGGVIAGLLFVVPGALVIALLALLYAQIGTLPQTESLLTGIKALVMVIVVQALMKVSSKALKSRSAYILAALAFVAIFLLHLPFPIVIAAAGLWGWLTAKTDHAALDTDRKGPSVKWPVILIWAGLWLLPLPLLWLSGQGFLFDIAVFFAKLAVVTFGGAYAVLAYMAQQVVQTHGWLSAPQMVDALGLAETTPGPLILVTQFVAMLAGHGVGGVVMALAAGLVTLWMTFVPCFLWIFAGAPHVETLLARPKLKSALEAITAAVVGVIANLSLWFALHVVFDTLTPVSIGPVDVPVPDLSSMNWGLLPLIALGATLVFVFKQNILLALLICALAGLGIGMI